MRHTFTRIALASLAATLCWSSLAQAQPEARVFRAENGRAMTSPSNASHEAIAKTFLQSRGASVDGLTSRTAHAVERTGVTHHRMEQRVNGLRIHGAYAKVAIDAEGRVLSAIENLVAHNGTVTPAAIASDEALDRAMNNLYGDQHPAMYRAPKAERVAIAHKGSLQEGFLVETWTRDTNLLHYTLVDGRGNVVEVESRTNTDSYNVFTDNPDDTPQSVQAGPGAGNAESPNGWLFGGNQGSTDIAGNNVNAYLDTTNSNSSDGNGATISNGVFGTTFDFGSQPSSANNKEVAVQNLFYLNNVIHDKLYRHGFVEAVGNFQEDNFGNGGFGGDSVNAEAQDGSGTNNANFSTPNDGSNPRMQMYLFDGLGDHKVTVGGSTYLAMGAEFGPTLDASGLTGTVETVNDGSGVTSDACESVSSASGSGMIAKIDRGTCDFVTKVKNAQLAGYAGAIVANNAGDGILTMGGTDNTISIPSVFVGQTDGAAISGTATIAANGSVMMRDGDFDSDIVYHEYGHGLTWRMIGSMSGAMSGAIGEGMGDVLSFMMNGRPTVGSYATSSPEGIRRYSYEGYPLTYGDFSGSEVHDDGEIYAAAVWNVRKVFVREGVDLDRLWDYLVDGMNYTPAGPDMDDMRDGILASAAGSGDECLIWEGFAASGIGEGASTKSRGPNYTVTESFAIPASCTGPGGNTAPTASFTYSCTDLSCSFDGSGSSDDSGISSWSWTFGDSSNGSGETTGHTYGADGTFTVTLTVTDGGGLSDSTSQNVSVSSGSTGGGITLGATGYKIKGKHTVDLSWSGAGSSTVDVLRNGSLLVNTANDGAYTDATSNKGGAVYSYQVCEAGTSTCSNTVQVVF